MLKSIRHNLANLTNFAGRDARQTFWFWILIVVVAQYAITFAASIPMYVSMFSELFAAAQNPESIDDTAVAIDGMFDGMIESMKTLMVISLVVGIISTVLLAASFVRRLHDAGFSGLIALIPIAAYLASLAYSFVYLEQLEEMMRIAMEAEMDGGTGYDPFAMQTEMGLSSVLGWLAPLIGIIFGIWPTEEGTNRYGEEPVTG